MFSKRQNGGASVIVLGCDVAVWIASVGFLEEKQDSKKYYETLEHALLPFAADFYGQMATWVSQQDGASLNRSVFTRSWPIESGMRIIDWPARFPDLNIIENTWGIMVRSVYAHQILLDTIAQL